MASLLDLYFLLSWLMQIELSDSKLNAILSKQKIKVVIKIILAWDVLFIYVKATDNVATRDAIKVWKISKIVQAISTFWLRWNNLSPGWLL